MCTPTYSEDCMRARMQCQKGCTHTYTHAQVHAHTHTHTKERKHTCTLLYSLMVLHVDPLSGNVDSDGEQTTSATLRPHSYLMCVYDFPSDSKSNTKQQKIGMLVWNFNYSSECSGVPLFLPHWLLYNYNDRFKNQLLTYLLANVDSQSVYKKKVHIHRTCSVLEKRKRIVRKTTATKQRTWYKHVKG